MPSPTETHFEILKSAPLGKWIALSGDESRIVAVGSTYSEVVKESEKAGESDPLVIKTPSVWATFSV